MNLAFFLLPKSQVIYLNEGSSFRQGLEKIRRHGYAALPVISKDGRYLGMVNEGDFLWNIMSMGSVDSRDLEQARIDDIISDRYAPVPVTTDMDALIRHALDQNFVPVVDDLERKTFMGIITRRAMLAYFVDKSTDSAP